MHRRRHVHAAPAIEPCPVRFGLVAEIHLCDVLELEDLRPVGVDDHLAKLVDVLDFPRGLHVELPRPGNHFAAGDVRIVGLDRPQHPVQRNVSRGHPGKLQRDVHLLAREGPLVHAFQVLDRLQAILEPVRLFLQLAVGPRLADNRPLVDLHVRGAGLVHRQGGQLRRQLVTNRADLAGHLLVLVVDVDPVVVFDAEHGQPVAGLRADSLEPVQVLEPLFDRLHHQLFHVLGARPRVDRHHGVVGRVEGRILAARHGQEGAGAQRQHTDEHHQRETPVLDRDIGNAHGYSAVLIRLPSCR